MEPNGSTKVFLQLQPDPVTSNWLRDLQNQLHDKNVVTVPSSDLHMTIIHIGALHRVITAMQKYASIEKKIIYEQSKNLITDLETIRNDYTSVTINLDAEKFSYFGPHHAVGVILFKSNEQLHALHSAGLNALKKFVTFCGIKSPDTFLESDSNLRNALALRPHVTIAKNYKGPILDINTAPASFTVMQIVY